MFLVFGTMRTWSSPLHLHCLCVGWFESVSLWGGQPLQGACNEWRDIQKYQKLGADNVQGCEVNIRAWSFQSQARWLIWMCALAL